VDAVMNVWFHTWWMKFVRLISDQWQNPGVVEPEACAIFFFFLGGGDLSEKENTEL
jgi:hypothetical protein